MSTSDNMVRHGGDAADGGEVVPLFLSQGAQTAVEIAERLAAFISAAERTLDLALYDFRLSPPQGRIVADALRERSAAGVEIRIAYDADKPEQPTWERGHDPAPGGTGEFVRNLGLPYRRIGGEKLMHHKYLVRDAGAPEARIWTGSLNLTDDAFRLQENNVLELATPLLAEYYARNFEEMWSEQNFEESGAFDTRIVHLVYRGEPVRVRLLFSPGRGPSIDYDVAHRVANARRRVKVCSMLLNSGALLAALNDVLRDDQVEVDGVYDETQMRGVLKQWETVPRNRWKIRAVETIVEHAHLAGKDSTPYSPATPHDFMHNKVLIVDDLVITGSYNFSHSAELNAENILMLESPALAAAYSEYVDELIRRYR